MGKTELFKFDLTKPKSPMFIGSDLIRFRKTITSEGIFYVPTFVYPVGPAIQGWRVEIDGAVPQQREYICDGVPLELLLHDAWRLVLKTLLTDGVRVRMAFRPDRDILKGRDNVPLMDHHYLGRLKRMRLASQNWFRESEGHTDLRRADEKLSAEQRRKEDRIYRRYIDRLREHRRQSLRNNQSKGQKRGVS